MWYLGENSA
jgi:transposase